MSAEALTSSLPEPPIWTRVVAASRKERMAALESPASIWTRSSRLSWKGSESA